MRAPLFAAALATILGPALARADRLDPPPPPPPQVVYLVEAIGEGNTVDLGVVDVGTGTTTPILSDLGSGINHQLVVDPTMRRWAVTFHQTTEGAPLVLDGKPVTEPDGPHVVVAGQLGTPELTVMPGDPRCHSKRVACFETPLYFGAEGKVLVTRSEASSWWTWNRRVVAPGARPAPIVDKRLASTGLQLTPSVDGARAAYLGKRGGVFVTALPALTTAARPSLIKPARARAAAPPLVMSDPAPVGGHVFYFRRDPADQRVGFIAAWDLAARTEREVLRLTMPFPTWAYRFFPTPRGTVVFQDDVAFERATLHEVSLSTWAVTQVGADVRQLLDVSPDGRYAVAAAYAEPDPDRRRKKVFDQQLVVIDLERRREITRITLPARIPRIYDARFVAPAPPR